MTLYRIIVNIAHIFLCVLIFAQARLSENILRNIRDLQYITTVAICLYFNFTANQIPKVFLPHETEQFVRLFRYGLVALDIYRITTLPSGSYMYSLRSAKYVNGCR